jgi:hypothetical protein
MFDIYEVSAAPHFPDALKSSVSPIRPEVLCAMLARAFDDDTSIEVRLREGEIFVALTAGHPATL